jgi:hypothetical protein
VGKHIRTPSVNLNHSSDERKNTERKKQWAPRPYNAGHCLSISNRDKSLSSNHSIRDKAVNTETGFS